MSEPTEHENDEPTEPGVADVPEPDQPTEDEQAEEAAGEDAQPEPEPEAHATASVDAAKEQRRIAAALEREHKAHDTKLEKILGEAHEHVLPCPLCGEGLQGYVFPGDGPNLPDEQKEQALAFLNVSGPGVLNMVEGFHECEVCNGYGELSNPTKVPHFLKRTCHNCQGNGFKADQTASSNVAPITGAAQTAQHVPAGEVGPCPLCGALNSAGKAHFCNPVQATGAGGV